MDISLLEFYLRLFAIITNIFSQVHLVKVKDYLKSTILKEMNPDLCFESLCLFDEYYIQFSNLGQNRNIQELWRTINQIDIYTYKKQRFLIILRLLMFEKYLLNDTNNIPDLSLDEVIEETSNKLMIKKTLFQDCHHFIFQKHYQISNIQNVLIVKDDKKTDLPILYRQGFPGQLIFFYVEEQNLILFSYNGQQSLKYKNHHIDGSYIYIFNKGSLISGEGFEPLYYNQVLNKFKVKENVNLKMEIQDLEFKYENSNYGVHQLNIDIETEQLIGIIGRSGTGKSTLLNLLSGNKRPTNGHIKINGIDLNSEKLEGLIGYVSQDDLLIEELSVFKNLYFNAKLSFGDLSKKNLKHKVNKLLHELDLFEVKDMQVGSAINRLISGGQRKKLNIALELIREPWILFTDEPTSGLSSSDSKEIMELLSDQTKKGRLVVVNIHQPSSSIFKMFDKILILDRGGYPVYFGNPMESITYFNDYYQKIPINTSYCHFCENVNSESIFRIIEEKKTNEFGEYIKERKVSPEQWHELFLLKSKINIKSESKKEIPKTQFNRPNQYSQFKTFILRNCLEKKANKQYLLLTFTISPVLATVLSFLCRFGQSSENVDKYTYAFNDNIPSYFFMSVIVALFLGLIMSAEEIINDRKILLRESFLKLSSLSYICSKVFYVFSISAIQTILYVIIGHSILDIQGMTSLFWLMMFSVSCFANLLGLLISTLLKSVIAIYILVPLIIIPQMLLSGVVIKYDKINKYISSSENVPVVGDLMISRWAYEAMVVQQFSENDFQKKYFKTEQKESNIKYNLIFVIPEIQNAINTMEKIADVEQKSREYNFVVNELNRIDNKNEETFKYKNRLTIRELRKKTDDLNTLLSKELKLVTTRKDSITKSLLNQFGNVTQFLSFKNKNYNNALADLVLKTRELEPYKIAGNEMVRLMEPIYKEPATNNGRAHFFSASKKIGDLNISTYYFNLIISSLMSLTIFCVLLVTFYFQNPYTKNYLFNFKRKKKIIITSIVKFSH